jgi:hypothetical protein
VPARGAHWRWHCDVSASAVRLELKHGQGNVEDALGIRELAGGDGTFGITADDGLAAFVAQAHPVATTMALLKT